MDLTNSVALVTGANRGLGRHLAAQLLERGAKVYAGARNPDSVDLPGAIPLQIDVTDPASVESFAASVGACDVLVNNAGGALGLDSIAEADEEKWLTMYESNVMGQMRMTRALLPKLIESGDGHVVGVTSIAATEPYIGGAGYNAAKHAQRAMLRVLRQELLGQPVRVTEVAPGMVETEFSLVRFGGDEDAARRVYEGMQPLSAEDVAECIRWALVQPPHVNIDEIVVRPRDQATATSVHRR